MSSHSTGRRGGGAGPKRGEDEAGSVVDVGDLSDGEVAEAEARHASGVERVVGLHRVLQHGDADGRVHGRGAEAAAEAEAERLRADAAHGATLPGLPVSRVALARRRRRRHGWTAGDWGPPGEREVGRSGLDGQLGLANFLGFGGRFLDWTYGGRM